MTAAHAPRPPPRPKPKKPKRPARAQGPERTGRSSRPQGPAGPAGAKGDTGAPGSNGSNGKDGTSVTNTAEPKGVNCKEGGTKLVGISTTYACNGEKGAKGDEGEPWVPENTLPPGATLTGAWAFGELTADSAPPNLRVPISFSLPLAEPLSNEPGCGGTGEPTPPECEVHYISPDGKELLDPFGGEKISTKCTGTVAAPTAEPGHLCIYAGDIEKAPFQSNAAIFKASTEEVGASTAGAVLMVQFGEAGTTGYGTWAVTAEE